MELFRSASCSNISTGLRTSTFSTRRRVVTLWMRGLAPSWLGPSGTATFRVLSTLSPMVFSDEGPGHSSPWEFAFPNGVNTPVAGKFRVM